MLRYLEGREHITGYGYEPWHIRYVDSVLLAMEIAEKDITLEEYVGNYHAPEVQIDYGASKLYSREDLDDAIVQIKCRFATFAGCELHSLTYAGDDASNEENLRWVNSLDEAAGYTQVMKFVSSFHTPSSGSGELKPNEEYENYEWWLARTEEDGWQLVTWKTGTDK